jgi:hypothetical protein
MLPPVQRKPPPSPLRHPPHSSSSPAGSRKQPWWRRRQQGRRGPSLAPPAHSQGPAATRRLGRWCPSGQLSPTSATRRRCWPWQPTCGATPCSLPRVCVGVGWGGRGLYQEICGRVEVLCGPCLWVCVAVWRWECGLCECVGGGEGQWVVDPGDASQWDLLEHAVCRCLGR